MCDHTAPATPKEKNAFRAPRQLENLYTPLDYCAAERPWHTVNRISRQHTQTRECHAVLRALARPSSRQVTQQPAM